MQEVQGLKNDAAGAVQSGGPRPIRFAVRDNCLIAVAF